jgi:GDP-L-fucose synthase
LKSNKLKIKKVSNNELPIINIGSGESITIKNLALLIKKISQFKGRVIFDKKYPDGTINKNLDSSKIKKFKWYAKIKLEKGLEKIINSRH